MFIDKLWTDGEEITEGIITCISVYKIRKNATFINKVVIKGERGPVRTRM